jgi:hypothetical protein
MIYGTWNDRSMYRTGSLRAEEISKYKLDLVGVQEVKWDRGGTESGKYVFSMERGKGIMNSVQSFFIRQSYRQLRG